VNFGPPPVNSALRELKTEVQGAIVMTEEGEVKRVNWWLSTPPSCLSSPPQGPKVLLVASSAK